MAAVLVLCFPEEATELWAYQSWPRTAIGGGGREKRTPYPTPASITKPLQAGRSRFHGAHGRSWCDKKDSKRPQFHARNARVLKHLKLAGFGKNIVFIKTIVMIDEKKKTTLSNTQINKRF